MSWQWTKDRRRWRVALHYVVGSAITGSLAIGIGGVGFLLLWPTLSLLLVAANYASLGPAGFGKGADGRMRAAAQWLLAPYILCARMNSRLWTSGKPPAVRVSHRVWVGRFPSQRDLLASGVQTVVDLTAELPAFASADSWRCIPLLDLVPPSPLALRDAADEIERRQRRGPVLVCCALGYGRSAAAVVTWLLRTKRAVTLDGAVARLRYVHPRAVLHTADLEAIRLAVYDEAATLAPVPGDGARVAPLLRTPSLTD